MTNFFLLLALSAFSLTAFAQENPTGDSTAERCNVAVVDEGGEADAAAGSAQTGGTRTEER